MQKLLPLILVLVAALVGTAYFLLPSSEGEGEVDPAGTSTTELEAGDLTEQSDQASQPEAATLEDAAGMERSTLQGEQQPVAASTTPGGTGFVLARLVDPQGNPLGANELLARKKALFGAGEELARGTTASDGKVRLEVPAGEPVILEAKGAFWAPTEFALAALRADEEVAIGDLVLTPADRILGRVLDPQGAPVAGVHVDLRESGSSLMMQSKTHRTSISDEDGRYTLEAVPAGTYRLRAIGQGFAPATEDPVVIRADGRNVEMDLQLQEGRSVVGVVLDVDSRPLAGALVGPQRSLFDTSFAVTPDNPNPRREGVHTDAQGRFTLNGLDASVSQLAVRMEGFSTQRVAVPEEGKEAVVKMHRSLTLSGIVVDNRGKPVEGAEVKLDRAAEATEVWETGRREVGRTLSAADGSFTIKGLSVGSYLLDAYAIEGQLLEAELELQGDLADHRVELAAARHLVFLVEDAFGKPVADAAIEVRDAGVISAGDGIEFEVEHNESHEDGEGNTSTRVRQFGGGFEATTDAQGRAVMFGVPEGEYVATVTATGHAEGRLEFERLSGAQEEQLVLPQAAQLVVRVVSPMQRPQPGVEIYLKRLDEEAELVTEKSDGTGRVVWPRLEAGRYEVGYREAEAESTGMIMMGIGGKAKKKNHAVQEVDLIATAALEVLVEVRDLALPEVLVTRGGVPAVGVEAWLEKPMPGPMGGAMDFNRPGSTRTDAAGRALLPAKEPGSYELVVRAGRHAPQVRQEVDLSAGPQEFKMEIPGGEVLGNLFADGAPLPGATLTLAADTSGEEGGMRTRGMAIMMVDDGDGMNVEMASGNPNDASAVSDSDGDFRFTDVPPGKWVVQCRAAGYERWSSDPFTMHEDGTVDLGTQRLVKGAVLRGTDLSYDFDNPDTSSMFGMASILQLQDEKGETLDVSLTRSDGTYRFADLKAGTYILQRGSYTSEPITLSAGEDKTHDLPKE